MRPSRLNGIDGLSETPDWTAEGDQTGAFFGISVATAGDVNGDGYDDVIVGAYRYDNGQTDEGAAFVYHGSATGLSTTPNWMAESDQPALLGLSVGTAGDVNGDGYADAIVGAYGYDNGQIDEGRAFVYHGSASGLSTTPNWTAESEQVYAYFGYSVGTAGDVNGDGYTDVIVGAYSYDNGQTEEGRAFVYEGSPSGLSITPAWIGESDQDLAYFGASVGTAGDVNGDGYADVIVGAPYFDNGQGEEGRAFVYYGSDSGLSTVANWTAESDQAGASFGDSVGTAGDVNSDGYADVIVGGPSYDNDQLNEGRAFVYRGSTSGLSTTPNWTAESDQAAGFGTSVGTVGDVNGDGYGDVIVGAYAYDNGQQDEGRAFVYHGSASELSTTPNWTAEGDQAFAHFSSVGAAGDVNGDGLADAIVGASGYDNGQEAEGAAFVYHGSDLIFADSFETGDFSAWSTTQTDGGDLSVSPAAALVGAFGMQALIDDANPIFVADDTPTAESRYRARFYFDPNSLTMAAGDAHFVFAGFSGSSTPVTALEFRFTGTRYQLRARVRTDATAWANTPWFNLRDRPHFLEFDWRAASGPGANDGGLTLWIDGVQAADLTGVDNDTRRIDRVRWGAVAGLDAGTSGTYYFDEFESRQQTYIGP